NQQPGQQHQSSHHRGRHHRHDNQQQQQQPCPHPQGNPGSTTTGAVSAVASSTVPATAGKNQPLRRERIRWTSDQPLTPSQLRSKREEFWDTAPAFDGRREIWDALRAAACAMEASDHELAQVMCSDSYNKRRWHYAAQRPFNGQLRRARDPIPAAVSSEDTVAKAKRRLERHVTSGGGASLGSQRWYCYGRQLTDRMRIKECPIPRGFVIQVVQQQQQQQAAPTGDEPSQATSAGKRKESPKLLLF
uniref:Ubiquitin-like domain-containing protein n=1 Tax=Macrostomum lignano TaxID=282301 RepID=A0A1I8IR16_9PLAT